MKSADRKPTVPTGMTESSFQQPLGLDRSRDRVTGYLEELQPVAHQFHAHPEMAAAGLWTNPTDLANFALAVTQAWQGQEGALLSHDMAKDFLTIQKGTWGLGFQLHKKDEKVIGFSHTGGTVGFRSALFMLLDGRGVAIMTNSDTGRGAPVMRSLLSTVSSLYDLPFNRPEQKDWVALKEDEVSIYSGVYRFTNEGETADFKVYFEDEGISIGHPQFLPRATYYLEKIENDRAYFFNESGDSFQFSQMETGVPVLNMFDLKGIKQ